MIAATEGRPDDIMENLSAGYFRRCVEGGHTQWMPQQPVQFFGLGTGELTNRLKFGRARVVQQRMRPAYGGPLLTSAQSLSTEQSNQ